MKNETRTGTDVGHVAKLIDDIRIALLTTAVAGGALARRTMAVLEEEATLPNGEQNPGKLINANANAECSVASFGAPVGKHRRAEYDAGMAPPR